MQRWNWTLAALALVIVLCTAGSGFAVRTMPTFKVGDKVEVRYHSKWVAAKVLAREDNIYHVQFRENVQLPQAWVPATIMRAAGDRFNTRAMVFIREGKPNPPIAQDMAKLETATAGSMVDFYPKPKPKETASKKNAGAQTKSDASELKMPKFRIRQKVQVKEHDEWRDGIVTKKDGDIYYVEFSDQSSRWRRSVHHGLNRRRPMLIGTGKWVQAIHMRRPGSKVRVEGSIWPAFSDDKPPQPTLDDLAKARAGYDFMKGKPTRAPRSLRNAPASQASRLSPKQQALAAKDRNQMKQDAASVRLLDASANVPVDKVAIQATRLTIVPHPKATAQLWRGASEAPAVVQSPATATYTPQPDQPADYGPISYGELVGIPGATTIKYERILVSEGTPPTVAVHRDLPFEDLTAIDLVTLGQSQATGLLVLPQHIVPQAISPNGKRLVLGESAFGRNTGALAVVERREDKMHVHVDGLPKPTGNVFGGRTRTWAQFLDDDHLLVAFESGQLMLWRIDEEGAEAVYKADVLGDVSGQPQSSLQLLPNRRYVLVRGKSVVRLIEAKTGQIVKSIDTQGGRILGAHVSPDGKKLLCHMRESTAIYSLMDDANQPPYLMPVKLSQPTWFTKELLWDGGKIISVESGVTVWRFSTGMTQAARLMGTHHWWVARDAFGDRDGPGKLQVRNLYRSQMTSLARTIPLARYQAQLKADITIDCRIKDSRWDREVEERLKKNATNAGYTLKNDAALVLKVWSSDEQTRKINVRKMHGGSDETVHVNEWVLNKQLVRDGKAGPPSRTRIQANHSFINTKRGQSAQQWYDQVLEEKTKKALERMGVPSLRDQAIRNIGGKVEWLDR